MKLHVFAPVNFFYGFVLALSLSVHAGQEFMDSVPERNDLIGIEKEEAIVLEHVLEHMLGQVGDDENSRELLVRCYDALVENKDISIVDLRELLPAMISFVKEEMRAARPDAGDSLGNGALSGCNGCGCDLSQILAILNSLQAKLTILIACCNEVLIDLQGTFSVLANLNVTATVDLSPIFTMISACCNGTFSAIADIKSSLTAITVNLNPVFTALTACCNGTFSMLNKIDTEVIGTFSLLNTIIINEQATFTALAACCNGTFSAIADIKSSLTAITVNLNPVFTALTACCNGTFSMLNKIDTEVIGTFSVLNTIIINEQGTFTALAACCNGTFSAIADIKSSLTAITVNLNPVFTALNACCNSTFSMLDKIDREVIGTFSVINACCNGTFSALANLTVTATADLSGVFSALSACCNGTFSAIADIKSSLTAITVNLNPVFTALAACCNGTFSVLANLTVTATTDLSGVFSALAACCNGTFSSLANLSVTATADLSGVFTALAACCNGTFSVLNQVNNNVLDVLESVGVVIFNQRGTFSALAECCNGTFSAIADIKSSLTALQVNFSPVFTVINAGFNGTFSALAACCNGTFSAINQLSINQQGTFTLINAGFNGTFSALASCCNGTFSVLNRILLDNQGSFTQVAVGFNGTFSALAACCNGTFSAINQLSINQQGTFSLINAGFNSTFSAITACCNGTFSLLNRVLLDNQGSFTQVAAGFNGTFSALAACCNGTFSSLFDIKNTLTACGAIPIFTATIITVSGNYCLANDIVGTITISASEVSLNMNDKTIFGGATAIPLIIGSGNTNVIVGNGTLQNSSIRGALITTCTEITLTNVNFVSNNAGVLISACGDVTVSNCFFYNNQARLVDIANSNRVKVINSSFSNNTAASLGISMIDINGGSRDITIDSDQIAMNSTYESIISLRNSLGADISITNCVIQDNTLAPNPASAFGSWVMRIPGLAPASAFPSNLLIQNCLIRGNSQSAGGTFLLIDMAFLTANGWNVNNNTLQNNTADDMRALIIGSGTGVLAYNNVSNNVGAIITSEGIRYTSRGVAASRIIANQVQGHAINYNPGTGIPLVQISFATGGTTTVSAGNVTPFHNLEMVP
ncbi:MAG TPA: right-handed parallel beta-helix repeat-containing protein [Candidatus Babeliales bacterium]|nr:right-handed parallel beta-helix repeat-containing protein [Candidatus Babeliales bacterium]